MAADRRAHRILHEEAGTSGETTDTATRRRTDIAKNLCVERQQRSVHERLSLPTAYPSLFVRKQPPLILFFDKIKSSGRLSSYRGERAPQTLASRK